MVTNDATLLRIKHDVLCEVAKGAWEGKLEQKKEEIPYTLIPGPQAQFRCRPSSAAASIKSGRSSARG